MYLWLTGQGEFSFPVSMMRVGRGIYFTVTRDPSIIAQDEVNNDVGVFLHLNGKLKKALVKI